MWLGVLYPHTLQTLVDSVTLSGIAKVFRELNNRSYCEPQTTRIINLKVIRVLKSFGY